LINIPFVILRARLLSAVFASISLARVVIGTGLTIWFVVAKNMGVEGVLLANLIVSGIMFLLAPLIPKIIHKKFWLKISVSKLKEMLSFGLPMVPGIFAAWIMSSADRYFLEHFSGRDELGLYSIGFRFASILSIAFIQPFRKTWPAIFYPKAQEGDAQEVFSKFATYFLLVGCIGSLGIICSSEHLIQILGPEEYWGAYSVVPILVIGTLMHGLQATINLGLFVKRKTGYAPIIVVIAAVSNVCFNYLLGPKYGMLGAAVGTLMSFIIMLLITFYVNQKIYPIHYEYNRLCHLLFLFVLVLFVDQYVQIEGFVLSLLFKIFIFFAFCILLFVTHFFKKSEMEVIYGTLKRVLIPRKYRAL
jgi:O-antigen/teichoic acid export membrane protein